MNADILNNIAWHSLSGPHLEHSVGSNHAKRYAMGFSPIAGFLDPLNPDLNALKPFCQAGEHLYISNWQGPCPPGWAVIADTSAYLMTWIGGKVELMTNEKMRILNSRDLPQVLKLAELAKLDPFGPKALELGLYFGIFEMGQLVAMGGERMFAQGLREIGSVATHPEYRHQGYARTIMGALIAEHQKNHELSFLHVMRDNEHAHHIYERMGFQLFKEIPVRVVAPA